MSLSSRAIKRIQRDLADILSENGRNELAENGIYVHVKDEDMKRVYVMFVGQSNTPYEHGFYFIEFTYPDDYPMSPPVAKYCTQGYLPGTSSSIRFNPNLYICGKVCLSMLNTWEGPCWVPTNTLTNVFMAIQALVLNETPLHNEPGYAALPAQDPSIQAYNRMIEYANCKIAILEMMRNPPKNFEVFVPVMEEYFMKHYDEIVAHVHKVRDILGGKPIHCNAYGSVHISANYEEILEKMAQNRAALSSLAAGSAPRCVETTLCGVEATSCGVEATSCGVDPMDAYAIAKLLEEDDAYYGEE